MYDSPTGDTFNAWPDRAELFADTFSVQVNAFRWVHAYSTEGDDVATFYGSDDVRVPMAQHQRTSANQIIDIRLVVEIVDSAAFCSANIERRRGEPLGICSNTIRHDLQRAFMQRGDGPRAARGRAPCFFSAALRGPPRLSV